MMCLFIASQILAQKEKPLVRVPWIDIVDVETFCDSITGDKMIRIEAKWNSWPICFFDILDLSGTPICQNISPVNVIPQTSSSNGFYEIPQSCIVNGGNYQIIGGCGQPTGSQTSILTFTANFENCNIFGCCPGRNLVVNGDFEASGNPGVNSPDYTYNPTVATGATLPGQYNIVTGAQASTINRCWVSQDPSNCPTNIAGKFLAVNGRTCGGKQIVWQQTFSVNDWTCYEFCASVKNLKEGCVCDFDVNPNIEVEFSMPLIGNITQLVNVSPGACNWINIKKQICLWGYGSSLTIKIFLNESIPGDGNDLALDNIALIAIPRCAPPVFQITTTPINATTYSILATATATTICPFLHWEVCEYTGLPGTGSCVPGSTMASPPIWWNLATNPFASYNGDGATLPPYNPTSLPSGVFVYGKMYRILLATWGECDAWEAFTRYIASSPRTKKVKTFTEEEFKKNPQAVLKALK